MVGRHATNIAPESTVISYARHLPAWGALLVFSLFAGGVRADTQSSSQPSELNSITVEAQRERKALEHQVDSFVFSVIVRHSVDNEGLARWNEPICPFMDGLLPEQSKFIVARLSVIAASAGARIAPEPCRPNFYVVAAPEPDQFAKKWYARNPRMFNSLHGRGPIKSFLSTPRPIRIWYNRDHGSNDGMPASDESLPLLGGTGMSGATATAQNTYPTFKLRNPTRLQWDGVENLSLVIAIIDTTRTRNLSVGQLADYIGLVGLAEVHLDAQIGSARSIMSAIEEHMLRVVAR